MRIPHEFDCGYQQECTESNGFRPGNAGLDISIKVVQHARLNYR